MKNTQWKRALKIMLMEKVGLHKWQDGNQYNAVLLDLYDSMTLMGIEDG